jgi:hypothetical protein
VPDPRFTDGGYQAPSTASAQLERGQAIKADRWTIGSCTVTLEIVPFTGGRPELCELALMITDRLAGHTDYIPCMLRGHELARQAFALTALELDAGRLPDRIILPDGAPLGW